MEAEIAEKLAKELPEWRYEGNWIRRTCKTHTCPGAILLIGTIGTLSEAAWHHPDLVVCYAFVEVKLCTHSAKGITNKDFDLAHKLEERPKRARGAGRQARAAGAKAGALLTARGSRRGEKTQRKARREAGLVSDPPIGADQYLASTGAGEAQLK